ncbi:MAG: phosphotriesterase, partial [Flavobacteriales bacterium]
PLLAAYPQAVTQEKFVMTVGGKMPVQNLGTIFPHEHIITDFLGAEHLKAPRYKEENALKVVLPHLLRLKQAGVGLLFECTPNYLGRNVQLLKTLSEMSGIAIVTNTGYYAAVDKKFLPRHAFTESAEAISKRWEREWKEGIGESGIRPGFIKLGVGDGPLDEIEAKLLRAALLLHKKSGLSIAMHTGDAAAANSEFEILSSEGVRASAMIWVHAQNASHEEREALAKKGVWISLDGVNEKGMAQYVEMIGKMKESGLLSHLLISQDDGWMVEEKNGAIQLETYENGNITPYNSILDLLLPQLLRSGFTQNEIDQLVIENPIKAYAIQE